MASTQRKSTSTTKKSGSSARSSSSSSRSRSSGSSTRSSSRSSSRQAAKKPIRREVWSLVCLLLALFALLGCFNVKALFIDFFSGLVKGLVGYGYWFLPLALLGAAVILAFHRGRPVRLRVWSALMLPILLGSMGHLLLCKAELPDSDRAKALWESGKAMTSGGLLSGTLATVLKAVFSVFGAWLILLLGVAALGMVVAKVTPSDILNWFQNRPHPEYEVEPEPERPVRERRTKPAPAEPRTAPSRRRAIDIPVDDGPYYEEPEPEPEPMPAPKPKEAKRGFFQKGTKPAPHELLTGGPVETPPEPEKPVAPPAAPPDPFQMPKEEILVQAAQIPVEPPAPPAAPPVVPTAPVPQQPMPKPKPEAVKDSAMGKLAKGEADEAAAQISAEVEAALQTKAAPVYDYPSLDLLKLGAVGDSGGVKSELQTNQNRLTDTIHSFGIDADIVSVTRGPSVTRYELELEQGVRLNKLTNLSDDIALALGASGVRIAPIPDKISMVGIEVPNKLVTPVAIREVLASDNFQKAASKVSFAVGKDIGGNCIVGNIAKLPHLLIAGTTGSGKSVCTNSLIISLLYKASPQEVRLIMVDPKMVELGIYNGIPHLLIPVVTDPKKAAGALQWAVVEMMKRYRAFSEVGVRDLASYNTYAKKTDGMEPMPQIVVVIDELADLMLVAAKEVEESICRVAQMGRAAGMHLIIATQRPSADVITGLMKANIPSRIAFAVASSLESRIILDQVGAEKLVGRGDMLFFPLGSGKPTRVQGCLISDEEVAAVVGHVKQGSTAQYDEAVMHEIEKNASDKEKGSKGVGGSAPEEVDGGYDELLPAAIQVVVETGMASVSMLQRRLKLGYSRAARLVDQMEEKGIVGPFEGSKPRQVLVTKEQWAELQYKEGMVPVAADAPSVSEPVPDELEFERDAVPQPTDLPPFDVDQESF